MEPIYVKSFGFGPLSRISVGANLDLMLDHSNQSVQVQRLDALGRTVAPERRSDFQQGRIAFDLGTLQTGSYDIHLKTSEESSGIIEIVRKE
jgi:hypothetical protein